MAGDEYRDVFIAEARDLTASLEVDLVDLEGHAGDVELINRIFRAAHTMKSSAAMFGFPQIASLTHAMESVLDRVRDGLLAIDAQVVNTLLDSLDCLRRMVDEATEGTDNDHSERLAPLCEHLQRVASGDCEGEDDCEGDCDCDWDGEVRMDAVASVAAGTSATHEGSPEATTYHIHLALNDDIFFQGTNPMLLLDELATLGDVEEICCDTSQVPEIGEIDPLKFYLVWDITLSTMASKQDVEDVFLFCQNDGDIRVEEVPAPTAGAASSGTGAPVATDGPADPVRSATERVQEEPASAAPTPSEPPPVAPADTPAAPPLTGALAEGAEANGLEAVAELAEDDIEILHDFHEESTESLADIEEKILALEEDPTDMETIHALFRTFHSMKGSAGFLELEVLGKLAHETENLLDRARNGELLLDTDSIGLLLTAIDLARGLNDNIGAFLKKHAVPDASTLNQLPVGDHVAAIRRFLAGERPAVATEPARPVVEPAKPIGKILVEKGAAAPADVGEAVAEQLAGSDKTIGTILVDKGKVAPAKVGEALAEQKAQRTQPAAHKVISAIRVDTERLDAMMNSVGEIVIAQSHALKLATEMEGEEAERLQTALYEVERLSRNLQDEVMGVRMMPIGPTFKQFARFVRDSSRELGKEVNFVITGEETELDKTVIEKIGDPLKHLIRNSLDHGLETPDERQAAGKSPKGTLELKAAHEGGSVVIEVIDDGHGIPRDKVLAKAIAKGLVPEDQELTDEQIYRLIFQAGFSTAEQVSSLSGRGVGMDVVKRNVDELRGSVDVESEEGKGSVLRIRLPLTLAIIEGMVVAVSGQAYIVPVLAIVESIRPRNSDIQHVSGQGEVLFFRDEYLPLYRLYEWLGHEPKITNPEEGIILVVEDSAGRRALLADDLLGQQQVVIKNLEDNFTKLPGISGATILAEGNVALILDILGLYDQRQATSTGVAA